MIDSPSRWRDWAAKEDGISGDTLTGSIASNGKGHHRDYEQVRQALAQKFDQLSEPIETLKSRLREAKQESRAALETQLAELERQRRSARTQVTAFPADSAEA